MPINIKQMPKLTFFPFHEHFSLHWAINWNSNSNKADGEHVLDIHGHNYTETTTELSSYLILNEQ